MTATKAQLREEIRRLRRVGYQMSNVCFNLGQESCHGEIGPRTKQSMRELRQEWDGIPHAERPTPTQGGNANRPSV